MTSGVKQALPQILMPKTGIEGKTTRNLAPKGDFAEALGVGKIAKLKISGEAKTDRQEAEMRPSWQRLSARLDTVIHRTRPVGHTLAAALSAPDPDKKPAVDRPADDLETATMEAPELVAAKLASDAAPDLVPDTLAVVPAKSDDAEKPEAQPAADDKPEIVVAMDAPAGDRTAPPSSSVKSTATRGRDQSAGPAFPMAKSGSVAPAATELRAGPKVIAAAAAPRTAADAAKEKDAVPEASRDTAKPAPRVTVLAQQNIPAPMPSTAIVLVESIAASDLLTPARTVLSLDAIHASAAPASAQSLKIQLHPAELGMVTATLRFAGQHLSIELQVESHEAHRRLTGDSDTIVNSLRDLGYDIERVTVLQPGSASTPVNRSDAAASMPSQQGRASDQFGSGAAGGGDGGTGGRQPDKAENPGQNGLSRAASAKENQGSGLYI